MNDKILSQDMHQRFLIDISDMIILVVNKMSFHDQKLMYHILDTVKAKEKTNEKNKNHDKKTFIVILHNFANLDSIESVEEYIQSDIINGRDKIVEKILDLKEPRKRQFISDNHNVVHLVIANKLSEAGDFYNETAFNYIRTKIKGFPFIRNVNISEYFLDFLKDNINNYYTDYENLEFKTKTEDNKIFIYPQKKHLEDNDDEKINEIDFNNKNPIFDLELKVPVINPLGFVSVNTGEFELDYSIKYNQDKFAIFIYMPGINKNILETLNMETEIQDNSISFNIKFCWENVFKKFDEIYPKDFYQNFKIIKENEASLYTVKIPFNEHIIDQNTLEFVKVEDGIIFIEVSIMKKKKIAINKIN